MNKEQILSHAQKDGLRRALVVTALSLEMKAVRAHLIHLGSVSGRSGTIYECGQFTASGSEWLIVVAQSGAGTHPAHNVVTTAHMDFDNFEFVIFVGIAGSRKEEARIGSVIASSYLYLPYSGKHDPALGFTARPHSLPIDRRLIGCAEKVERDGDWSARVREPLKTKLPDTADYPQPFPPAAFVAPIASIEAVSADPGSDLEATITRHFGDAFAVETEGYGAGYAAYSERTPLIVIRGISDMRGGKTAKNDAVHQPVAAAHAAAFSFELLDVWSRFQPHPGASLPRPAPQLLAETPTSQPIVLGASQKRIIVLNFEGAPTDFPPEKVEAIVTALKAVTDDLSLRVVGTEEGSFRLLIEGNAGSVDRIDASDVAGVLRRDLSVELLGIMGEDEYRSEKGLESSLQHASRDLLEWPQELPGGMHLARPEFDQLLSIFRDNESSTTALLGAPGSGKSALLASVAQALRERGTPFLAIKADLLNTAIQTENDLTESLSLPISVSSLLIDISQLRPVVLLIDQLDALAGYLDLRTGRLSVLLNLVRHLGGRRSIHIVVSARRFEFEHDARLKSVKADSLTLTLPPWSAVLEVLEQRGIKAAGWPEDAQELMRSPQALATFLRLNDRKNEPPFRTYQTMLDQLWRERILDLPNGSHIAKLAGEIAEKMADTESLWLPFARFDDKSGDLNALIASGILTDYEGAGGRIGFSHQTVFDHALARSFARGEGRLSTFVLERQSSLFVRPKLWAALAYLRDVDSAAYHSEFQKLWSREDLRVHLRHILIEFLGQQTTPTTTEAAAFEQALSASTRRVALQAVVGSPGWFKLLAYTHIASAMTDAKDVNLAALILDRAWSSAADIVVSLIKKNWLPDPVFDAYIWQVLQGCPSWTDEVTAIAKTVIERNEIAPFAFEQMVSAVGVYQSETALKLVSFRLSRQLAAATKEAEQRAALAPPEGDQQGFVWYMTNSPSKPLTDVLEKLNGWDSLDAIAKSHGRLFLQYLWPCFQAAMAALRQVREDRSRYGFSLPYILDFRFPDEHSLGLSEPPLLAAFATAITAFASADENEFLDWLSKNEQEDATPAQRLFAHALASEPRRYAERAATFLLEDKRRFYLGNVEDYHSTTKRLISVSSAHWSDELLTSFALEVMAYTQPFPAELPPKSRQHFSEVIRRTRLALLGVLPAERLPEKVRRYTEEERRRFPDEKIGATFSGPTWIGSPMSAQHMALASDADILNAFRKLPDASNWDHPTQWMKGGNIQLSREFAEFAKTHPARAVDLIEQFEPGFGSRGAGYAIDALAESFDPTIILELTHKLNGRGFGGSEFRDSVARAVERLIRRDAQINDQMVALLESWLVNPAKENESDGEEDDAADDDVSDKSDELTDSVLWGHGGLSIFPHGNFPVLEAITRALLAREDHDRLLSLYERHLAVQEREEVWQALLQFFLYIRPTDMDRFGRFIIELFARYPALAAKREAAILYAYLHWRLPETVRQLISTWRNSSVRELQQAYGELVALFALVRSDLSWPNKMLDEILEDADLQHARVGAAHAAVNLWADADGRYRSAASEVLQRIIPKADQAAWSAIFDLFRLVDEITPEREWVSLLQVLSKHFGKASVLDSSFVVDRLQTLLPHQALLVAEIARGLVANWRGELGDLRTGTAMVARDLVDLAITLHRLGPDTRDVGTSLFEDLLDVNAYMARETLDEIDNRFRAVAAPPRRLPRRTRRPAPRQSAQRGRKNAS